MKLDRKLPWMTSSKIQQSVLIDPATTKWLIPYFTFIEIVAKTFFFGYLEDREKNYAPAKTSVNFE